jgi:ATP-binding cassette subfamily F protein 3
MLSYQTSDSILSVALQAFEEANQVQKQIDEVLHKLEHDYHDKLVNRLTTLQERFDQLGGYSLQAQAEEILEGIGFTTKDLQRPLNEFSGGWRMRVMLAKLLLEQPDLLMLDEPTNHLDMQSVQILIQALNQYKGSYLVVSHDRHFIAQIANKIWYIENQQIKSYPGSYDEYEYWLQQRSTQTISVPQIEANTNKSKATNKPKSKTRDQDQVKALQQKLTRVEDRISNLEEQRNLLEQELSDPQVFGDPQRLATTTEQFQSNQEQLESATQEWEELAQQIDDLV